MIEDQKKKNISDMYMKNVFEQLNHIERKRILISVLDFFLFVDKKMYVLIFKMHRFVLSCFRARSRTYRDVPSNY